MVRGSSRVRRPLVGAVVVALVGVAGLPATAAEGDVTGYDIPTPDTSPHGVAQGPDGAVWFTERLTDQIGRLDAGVFTEWPLALGAGPSAITAGPDGNLWFTEQGAEVIGRLSPTGTLDEFPLTASPAAPTSIVTGPDGAMWFTERAASRIGRLSVDGQSLDEWPTLTPNAAPMAIVAGPDGALWFTLRNAGKLGRIATDGTLSEYPLPAGSQPNGLATGPDGNLWVALRGRNSIGRVTPGGALDAEFPIPATNAGAMHIAPGPLGALWFTETTTGAVAKIDAAGAIVEYPLAAGAGPQGIVAGTDGHLWFAESGANRIASLDPGEGTPADTRPPTIEIRSPLTGTVLVADHSIASDYACADEPGGSGLASCDGPVADGDPIPTDVLGVRTFDVRAADVAGNEAEVSTGYLVFRSISGSLVRSPRPRAWLKLRLGMDLDRHAPDPLARATTQEVSCVDGSAVGELEPAEVYANVKHHGMLKIWWHTDRDWAGTCRTLSLEFSASGWEGVPATFSLAWASGRRDR